MIRLTDGRNYRVVLEHTQSISARISHMLIKRNEYSQQFGMDKIYRKHKDVMRKGFYICEAA